MSDRFTNLALLVFALLAAASGVLLFSTNLPYHAWLYDLHRVSGLMLVLLLIPKTRIVLRALARQIARHTWFSPQTFVSLFLTALVLLTLAFVFAWTLDLLPLYLQIVIWATPLAFHWYFALALIIPLFVHALYRFPRGVTYKNALTRRDALYALGWGVVAMLGWGGLSALADLTNLTRRFTGSRLTNSFRGNDFPVTSSDVPAPLDASAWRLYVRGEKEIVLTYAEVLALASAQVNATVDCTLGWASTQTWRGVSLKSLLERAGLPNDARKVQIRAVNGYYVVLSLEEARASVLATHVGDEMLSHEHGFPVRLVAPARRGYHWIKWVSEVLVSA